MAKTINEGLRLKRDVTALTLTVQVVDFEADKVIEQDAFSMNGVPEVLHNEVLLYGLGALLKDRTSQVKENPREKLKQMGDVFARLEAGHWEAERSGRGLGIVSVEVEALAALKGISIPDAQRALKSYAPEQRAKILASEPVQKKAEELRKEREGASEVRLDDLLS